MSYTRRIFWSFLVFGVFMGGIFPFFAKMFVTVPKEMEVYFTISCIVAGIAMGLMSFTVYKIVIGNVIKQLSILFQEVSKGNLNVSSSIKSKDDIGKLSDSINEMIHKWTHLLKEIKVSIFEMAEQTERSSQLLTVNVSNTIDLAEGISIASKSVAVENERQKRQAEESATIIGEITAGIQLIAASSSVVSEISVASAQDADSGKGSVEQMIGQMQTISHSVKQSASMIEGLAERSLQVQEMADTISMVAAQTNLLALNAGIEAARAGEHGKGFAVVAQEVRKLAEQSQAMSQEITTIVTAIREETVTSSDAMKQVMEEVEQGLDKVNQSGQAFMKIVAAVSEVSMQISDVSASVQQMAAGAEQIAASFEHMADTAKKVSSKSAMVSGYTEDQLSEIRDISGLAEELNHISSRLKTAISQINV